ncbi:hypothetical protein WOC76_01305 [Methylocystis sp. IM3]|uniref:hypothetical protein n=1 Tax=unclassified Methylocystis TaxID=2625913 RepID=UPI0030F551BC
MNKRFALAVVASFPFLGSSFCDWAAPFTHAEDHHGFSVEDRAAFTDARIAALKARLKLTSVQENRLTGVRHGAPTTPQKSVLSEWLTWTTPKQLVSSPAGLFT